LTKHREDQDLTGISFFVGLAVAWASPSASWKSV